MFVDDREKTAPVLAEGETIGAGDGGHRLERLDI
jgi:hypothetical protein